MVLVLIYCFTHLIRIINFVDTVESVERTGELSLPFDERLVINEGKDDKFYNFTIQFSIESKPFHLYTKVPSTYTFPYKAHHSPIPFFFTRYIVQTLEFEEFPEQFLIKEGTRCRFNCSKLTRECEAFECWDRPFVCFGDKSECMKLEGNGTCIKTEEGTNSGEEELENNDFEILSSTFFFDLLHLSVYKIVSQKYGWVHLDGGITNTWECELRDENNVFCINTGGFAGPSSQLLKTLAG